MCRVALLFTIAALCTACIEHESDSSPLAGDWRVDRSLRTATADCPRLGLPPLSMTLQ